MRELNIGTKRFTKILALGGPGPDGVGHEYSLCPIEKSKDLSQDDEFGHIVFQDGPIKEVGVNGCHNEDLLAIVIDRLQGFQAGDLACDANEEALQYLDDALSCLNLRTQDRIKRGVEGTSQI